MYEEMTHLVITSDSIIMVERRDSYKKNKMKRIEQELRNILFAILCGVGVASFTAGADGELETMGHSDEPNIPPQEYPKAFILPSNDLKVRSKENHITYH